MNLLIFEHNEDNIRAKTFISWWNNTSNLFEYSNIKIKSKDTFIEEEIEMDERTPHFDISLPNKVFFFKNYKLL